MTIIHLAKKEAEHLLRVCEPIELQRLDLDLLDGNSTDQLCLYGMLTGNPDSKRAIEIICQCTGKVICNDIENDGKAVPVDELKAFLKDYDDGIRIIETGRIIDYSKRSLYFVSPLEVYVPSEDHPERDKRIAQIRSWLCL